MGSELGNVIDKEVERLINKDIIRRQVKKDNNPDKLYDLLKISEIAKKKREKKDFQ